MSAFSTSTLALMLLSIIKISIANAALSATTANTIQGHKPYLSFDGGVTKASDLNSLVGIKIGSTFYDGTYSGGTIVLPNTTDTFTDVEFISGVTPDGVLKNLSTLASGYFYDDDGDALDPLVTTGSLSAVWKDNYNTVVPVTELSNPLDLCKAPYTLTINVYSAKIATKYGDPLDNNYGSNTVSYHISPKEQPMLCFAKPDLTGGNGIAIAGMWVPTRGFFVQSLTDYSQNFPTVGFNSAYFDLDVVDIVPNTLTWTVNGILNSSTVSGVTAKVNTTSTNIRITLNGPSATSLPTNKFTGAQFEIIGTNGTVTVKYGFNLNKWVIHREAANINYVNTVNYCNTMGGAVGNYNVVELGDFMQSSTAKDNGYPRRIAYGMMSEWGNLTKYGWSQYAYWTSTKYLGGTTYRRVIDGSTGKWDHSVASYYAKQACISP